MDKNNRTVTGYEKFCIKKGSTELFPFKDFDFVGKNVICLKCCQKFASKMSYRAHIGTDYCVRTYNGPNLVYLKFKNKTGKRNRKKNNLKSLEDLHGHDIKKNLLNPEMLNTLQTRKKCYSDAVLDRYKVKEKQVSNKNNEFSMKKPRGRPKKNIEIEPKKRGRPRKSGTPLDGNLSPCQNEKRLNDDSDSDEMFKKPKIVGVYSVDAYNNNIGKSEKLKSLSSKMKFLTECAWKIINDDKEKDLDINSYQNFLERYIKIPSSEKEENNLYLDVELISSNLKSLLKENQDWIQNFNKEEIDLILLKLEEKRNENKNKHKKTDFSGSVPNKGKENIECAGKQSIDEIEINILNNHFDENEKCEEIWVNDDNENYDSSSLPVILKNDSTSTNYEHIKKESTGEHIFEEDVETLTGNNMPSSVVPVNMHLNNLELNYVHNPAISCDVCGKQFASIGECKVHYSEHLAMANQANKEYLCKVCGHKCKIFKNFVKHLNSHNNVNINLMDDKISLKNFRCKICNRNYNYLRSFYSHVQTHINVI